MINEEIKLAEGRLAKTLRPEMVDKILMFCRSYAESNDLIEAGKRAGWKSGLEKRGKAVLDNPLCEDLINIYREEWAATHDRLALSQGINIGDLQVLATRTDILNAEDKRIMLSSIARNACDLAEFRAAIAAINELNKMDGDLAPAKTEVKGKLEHAHSYADHTDEQLEAAILDIEKELGITRH